MKFRALILLLAVGLMSCSGPEVGSSCRSDRDCSWGLFCAALLPGGYCTAVCGPSFPCPRGAICAEIQTEGETFSRCLKPCSDNGDCRKNYKCLQLENSSEKVCYPKK